MTFSVFCLLEVLIRRGTFCWKPHLTRTSGFKVKMPLKKKTKTTVSNSEAWRLKQMVGLYSPSGWQLVKIISQNAVIPIQHAQYVLCMWNSDMPGGREIYHPCSIFGLAQILYSHCWLRKWIVERSLSQFRSGYYMWLFAHTILSITEEQWSSQVEQDYINSLL